MTESAAHVRVIEETPAYHHRIQALLERGLQREIDFENRWPEVLGTLIET